MKMSQWSRFCLSGLAALVIMFAVVLQPQHAFSQLTSPLPTPTAPATDVIDLTVDKDHDGMPDQLQAAIQEYEAVLDAVNKKGGDPRNDPASLDVLQKADDKLVRRMPYSEQTRAAGARLAALYQKFSQASDQTTREKLWTEVQLLQVQMLQDPNFALVDQLTSRLLLDALKAKTEAGKADPRNTQLAPQPTVVSSTATPTEAQGAAALAADVGLIQAAAANGGGQTLVPISWSQFFPRDPCASTQTPNFNLLIRGEIIFYGHDGPYANFLYAKKWTHTALYDGVDNANIRNVYEAADPDTGVRRNPLFPKFQKADACIAFATVTGTTAVQRQSALDWAEATYGTNGTTPYNLNFIDKTTNSAIYCSQLIWKTFMHLGKDLDSNNTIYGAWLVLHLAVFGLPTGYIASNLMVAPDEIALHPDVFIYHEGLNPP